MGKILKIHSRKMVAVKSTYLTILLITTTLLISDIYTFDGLLPKESISEAEKEYQASSFEEKAKRCTGKVSQIPCNKIEHCCWVRYKPPDELQRISDHSICVDSSVFMKFYIGNAEKYLEKTKQTSMGHLTQHNLCHALKSDKDFGKIR